MDMKKFEFLDHPAELKIRSFGKDLPELFINTALGMMEYLYGKIETCVPAKTESVTVEAHDLESLLVDWLAEILWLSDTNKRAYVSYYIKHLTKLEIISEVGSIKAKPINDIKAVTYHELAIIKDNNGWQATVVYDI